MAQFHNNYIDMFLLCVFTKNAKMVRLGWTKWPPELKIAKNQTLAGLLSLLVLDRVFFPCWLITWSSFPAGASQSSPAGASHGFLSLLVVHKFPSINNQTKWSPFLTYLKPWHHHIHMLSFSSYAPLQKIAIKSCKQDNNKNYLSCCIET